MQVLAQQVVQVQPRQGLAAQQGLLIAQVLEQQVVQVQ